jgi:hypothetical protein
MATKYRKHIYDRYLFTAPTSFPSGTQASRTSTHNDGVELLRVNRIADSN